MAEKKKTRKKKVETIDNMQALIGTILQEGSFCLVIPPKKTDENDAIFEQKTQIVQGIAQTIHEKIVSEIRSFSDKINLKIDVKTIVKIG